MRLGQQKQVQRPLQNELVTLHKSLGGDVLEQAARILDHFSAMENSKLERGSLNIPTHLSDKLQEKCDQFETVCDQIYYILEQSKRVLQLDWQQQKLAERQKPEQQEQNASQSGANHATVSTGPDEDMGTDLTLSNVDLTDNDAMEDIQRDNDHQTTDVVMEEEEDMEEMLQLQRERLDRLRNVIVHGVDVETIKASQSQGKDDILF
ncbi:predicted protein [Lichtheimia corymbifera JMRC:FSU:9682]|uniref:Uncharacterized protein n=1 Tax=Lichtheimia corymbifera JMRC:FSU:9682 TaxID=1263082 RepID=A0A068S8B5_9FUNG|nr:predicted protein [Lichtheimia corymbifera JMRC:FSU:9682]